MPEDRETIIFMHIPKTGGTTLHSILTWQYLGAPSIWLIPDGADDRRRPPQIRELNARDKEKIDLVRGHSFFGIHKELPRPSRYVTFVRHPLGHVRSQYNYYQTEGPGEESLCDRRSIEDILFDESLRLLDNNQVRWISGVGFEPQSVGKAEFEQAMENLDTHFAMFGLTKYFRESVVLFGQTLGWTRPIFYKPAKVKNRSGPREELGDQLSDLIVEKNKWDMKLYDRVEEQLEKKITDQVKIEAARLKRRNRVVGPVIDLWRGIRSAVGV